MKQSLILCLLLALGASRVNAGIILDDAPQDAAPAKSIDVPNPRDSAGGDRHSGAVTDVLRFLNGDTLHGKFAGYEKAAGLRWQSLEAKDPIAFNPGNIQEIKLDSLKPPANATPPTQAVTLTNNDEIPGNLVSMDDKTLVLDTWYAGKLTIPRPMIKSIVPLKVSTSVLYQGPTGLDGWTVGPRGNRERSWTYRDGSLVAMNYGLVGRDVKLPPLAAVDFDFICRGNSQMGVSLYAEKSDNMSNSYGLQIGNGYVYFQRYSNEGSNSFGEQIPMRGDMMRRDRTHVSIRANKETKTFWLFLNGNLVKTWTDPAAEFAGKGTALVFTSQQGTYVKISNIVVASWDGQVESVKVADKPKEDSIKMANQDKVSGKLKSIENGKALFASSYADLTIPLDRVEIITMSTEGTDLAKRGTSDVRAYFAGRGSITMTLESWDGKEAVSTSPNFGKATFAPAAFQRLKFNLNRQPAASDFSSDTESSGDGDDSQQ